jgi:hypothetical protein
VVEKSSASKRGRSKYLELGRIVMIRRRPKKRDSRFSFTVDSEFSEEVDSHPSALSQHSEMKDHCPCYKPTLTQSSREILRSAEVLAIWKADKI